MKQPYLTSILIPTFLAWSVGFNNVAEKSQEALNQGRVKEALDLYIDFLKTAENEEIGWSKMRLAMIYYKDQEHEKAFATFLEALDAPLEKKNSILSDDEREVYDPALKIYMDSAGLIPQETAEKIISQFESIYKQNPDFHHLGYILAMSYANLGRYDCFFDLFYQSYEHHPEHFLAYKAKAALHLKLFERAKTESQREEQRKQIVFHAEQALALQPRDSSLYRMILGFTPEDSKGKVLSTYLNKIMDQNIVVSRIDIPYFTEIAIAFEQYDLAQKFLDKTRDWYSYSRVVQALQQRLNEKRSQK